jgi:8-amino-3,8-dideoxy-alpha-D-manno-octulosonate transaminase
LKISNKAWPPNIVDILNKEGFGTKNLPDAMEWHCTAFWDHALDNKQIVHSQKTRKLLDSAIAVPIWLRKNPDEYALLARMLFS